MNPRPILFLDVDGVLIAYPDEDYTPPAFTSRCVGELQSILSAVPALRIVLSTTWRLDFYVQRLHDQWVAHGLDPDLVIDGTPDTRNDPAVSPFIRRGREIQLWLEAHPGVSNWVVLDDEKMGIEETLGCDRCVFTNPRIGLDGVEAARVIELLCQPGRAE